MEDQERKKLKKRAEKVLGDAKKLINGPDFNENMSLKNFFEAINVKEEEYVKLLGISTRGKVLIWKGKCNEVFVNNYNPEMLAARDANMDLQLTVDPYAVISYIASYMH